MQFDKLLSRLNIDLPDITLVKGEEFSWSPNKSTVTYVTPKDGSDEAAHLMSLLHEMGHCLIEKQSYTSDVELLRIETEAWNRAKQLANKYSVTIDEDYVQDCLDTYRDWLHKRSICPKCKTGSGIQLDKGEQRYSCINCHKEWKTSASIHKRIYRKTL